MPLTVHIGLPKTGTTYLQKTLAAARPALGRAGVDYPDTGYYNHQIALYEPLAGHLPWTARPGLPDRWVALRDVLSAEDGRHTLLSAEALSALDEAGVERFAGLVAARQLAHLVITSRSLERLLPSHWQQNLKQGAVDSLEAFSIATLARVEEGAHPGAMYSAGLALHRWRRVFPSVRVTVLAMGADFAANLAAFAGACSIPPAVDLAAAVPPASEQNLSFSVDECRRLQVLNHRIAAGRAIERDRRRTMAIFFRQRDAGLPYEKPVLPPALVARARELDRWAERACEDDPACGLVRIGASAVPASAG
ncbi:hypothetical protein [Ideonella sp.]|uniref:hypothetical protein n=1 Tax=Ideonella sp. TaxID=1929293 RepID=UPI0035B33CAA